MQTTTEPQLIRIKQVMEITGLSKSYLYNLTANGNFPRSVNIVPGGSSKGWIKEEIVSWVQQRIDERNRTIHQLYG